MGKPGGKSGPQKVSSTRRHKAGKPRFLSDMKVGESAQVYPPRGRESCLCLLMVPPQYRDEVVPNHCVVTHRGHGMGISDISPTGSLQEEETLLWLDPSHR